MATSAERKEAAARMRAEIAADRASRPERREPPVDYSHRDTHPEAPKPKPAPKPAPGSVESQIGEIYGRAGGYLRKQGK